ncbi:MAG: GNAT family N-acetyltransferase [Rhodothermales bacterium]|nr:GNAT family N-acetyltransferase [Rhodothermales bacterium]
MGGSTKMVELEHQHRDRLITLFTSAFSQYPLFEILLAHSEDRSGTEIRDIITFWVDIYLSNGYQLIGCIIDNMLIAGAMITPPDAEFDTKGIEELSKRLIDQIGQDMFVRLEDFENATESGLPLKTHHNLGILAVDPEFQRRGIGRLLIEHVSTEAALHATSSGVCLTTEALENVGYYQSLGFTTITQVTVHGIESWGMRLDL